MTKNGSWRNDSLNRNRNFNQASTKQSNQSNRVDFFHENYLDLYKNGDESAKKSNYTLYINKPILNITTV